MTQHHPIQNGDIMLVTTNVKDRKPLFVNDAYAQKAVEQIYTVREHTPFTIYGLVIMPDHCHFLVRVLPPQTIAKIMRQYKMGLAFELGIGPLWHPRFHIQLCDEENPRGVLEYIHRNPVKAGLAESSEEYRWSSASGEWPVTPLPVAVPMRMTAED